MTQILQVLDNALMQGLTLGLGVLGLAVAFRVLRYPDLTADGSFLAGAAVFGQLIGSGGWTWQGAFAAAIVAGGIAGAVTALLRAKLGVNRLLTGILTSMAAYSIAFRILGGRPNQGLSASTTMFSAARAHDTGGLWGQAFHPWTIAVCLAFAAGGALLLLALLRSDLGLLLRATGANPDLVEGIARRPERYEILGLTVANALIGAAGALSVGRQGFVDVNMGAGIIIILVASLVIGEQAIRGFGLDPAVSLRARVAAPMLGAVIYFAFYLGILRASILGLIPFEVRPTDLKLLSAAVVAGAILLRSRTAAAGEEMFRF